MTIVARFYKNGKGVAGNGLPLHGTAVIIFGAGQVAVNAVNIGVVMNKVGLVLRLLLVTVSTELICGYRRMRLLGMNFVAVDTGYAGCAMPAGLPLVQGAGVAATAQPGRGSNGHTLLRMALPVGAVARLAGDAGQHKLAGVGIIPGGVAGKTFAGLLHLLQISLKNGVKRGFGVNGVRPHLKFCFVTLAAALGALVVAPHRKRIALRFFSQRSAPYWPP